MGHEELKAIPRRRIADDSIDHLHECVEGLKGEMAALKGDMTTTKNTVTHISEKLDKNSETTEAVRDILVSFKLFGKVAKWVSRVVGAFLAIGAAIVAVWDRIPHK